MWILHAPLRDETSVAVMPSLFSLTVNGGDHDSMCEKTHPDRDHEHAESDECFGNRTFWLGVQSQVGERFIGGSHQKDGKSQ